MEGWQDAGFRVEAGQGRGPMVEQPGVWILGEGAVCLEAVKGCGGYGGKGRSFSPATHPRRALAVPHEPISPPSPDLIPHQLKTSFKIRMLFLPTVCTPYLLTVVTPYLLPPPFRVRLTSRRRRK